MLVYFFGSLKYKFNHITKFNYLAGLTVLNPYKKLSLRTPNS
ncbi:hypothetical protein CWATWH8502_2491 [Crocosphaera watsonii WH 8502]|uniref:Uncharacterized protein n=1 Tax=Crocosphaera watsonii WH 8502 TaxID=423474 RepID=T2IDU4_CROWT|nr:hypothetical protein CWATWH8502_2491 [Crocosphaera watsonii WH 8502]